MYHKLDLAYAYCTLFQKHLKNVFETAQSETKMIKHDLDAFKSERSLEICTTLKDRCDNSLSLVDFMNSKMKDFAKDIEERQFVADVS